MPILHWLNRDAAFRVAADVPYRQLVPVSSHGTGDAGNLLVQGDNLHALKALLPLYRGQVKCIFIDPPYNTRSAFEHYDDNLEHAQWLSMMLPRLQLLREFLREDGSIWVTIDDHEGHYLKVLMDEVFGRGNFVANVIWQKKYSVANDHKTIAPMHDHVLVYRQSSGWRRNLLERGEAKDRLYKFQDEHGQWRPDNYTCSKTADERPNLYYPIRHPLTGDEVWPKRTRVWAFSREQHQEHVRMNMLYWGKDGLGAVPAIKRYRHLLRQDGVVPQSLWEHEFAGHTDLSRKEVRAVLDTDSLTDDFLTPKPELLLSRVLQIGSESGDLILDSFLGSGTTAAVAHKMGRRWIGIEMGDHAVTHCLPRLEKVLAGEQGGISKAVGWQGGGGFRFVRLGEPVFDTEGRIHPHVRFAALAAHVWQQETRQPYPGPGAVPGTPVIGVHDGVAVCLLYNGILGDRRPEGGNVLTLAVLNALKAIVPHEGARVVYGEASRLGPARLAAEGVTFRQIPYELSAR
jgi:adenine-specific DNA-methyltransferase